MRTALVGILVGCLLAGVPACGNERAPVASPVGSWSVDPEGMLRGWLANHTEAERRLLGPQEIAVYQERVSQLKLHLELRADGTTVATTSMEGPAAKLPGGATSRGEGTWSLGGSQLVLRTLRVDGVLAKGSRAEPVLAEFKNDRISATLPDGSLLVLKRP